MWYTSSSYKGTLTGCLTPLSNLTVSIWYFYNGQKRQLSKNTWAPDVSESMSRLRYITQWGDLICSTFSMLVSSLFTILASSSIGRLCFCTKNGCCCDCTDISCIVSLTYRTKKKTLVCLTSSSTFALYTSSSSTVLFLRDFRKCDRENLRIWDLWCLKANCPSLQTLLPNHWRTAANHLKRGIDTIAMCTHFKQADNN